jgi:hypothetical protein
MEPVCSVGRGVRAIPREMLRATAMKSLHLQRGNHHHISIRTRMARAAKTSRRGKHHLNPTLPLPPPWPSKRRQWSVTQTGMHLRTQKWTRSHARSPPLVSSPLRCDSAVVAQHHAEGLALLHQVGAPRRVTSAIRWTQITTAQRSTTRARIKMWMGIWKWGSRAPWSRKPSRSRIKPRRCAAGVEGAE